MDAGHLLSHIPIEIVKRFKFRIKAVVEFICVTWITDLGHSTARLKHLILKYKQIQKAEFSQLLWTTKKGVSDGLWYIEWFIITRVASFAWR